MGRKNVFLMGDTAFLPGAKAAVVMTEDVGFLEDKKFTATVITPAKGSSVKKEVRFVPFGHQDKLPVRIMKKDRRQHDRRQQYRVQGEHGLRRWVDGLPEGEESGDPKRSSWRNLPRKRLRRYSSSYRIATTYG